MHAIYLSAIVPSIIVLFFFITLIWSYYSYKTLKSPFTPSQNPDVEYINNKTSYWEDIIISVGFIVIFLLIAVLVALYKIMFKLDK